MNPESMSYNEIFDFIINNQVTETGQDILRRALNVLEEKVEEKIESEVYDRVSGTEELENESNRYQAEIQRLQGEVDRFKKEIKILELELKKREDLSEENIKLKQKVEELLERLYGE